MESTLLKLNKSFYDTTLDYNWDMNPIDRSIDNDKVNCYLQTLPPKYVGFMKQLINKTKYVTYLEFKTKLLETFKLFIKSIQGTEFNILLPSNKKIGSEHWVIAILWPQIKSLNFKGFICNSTGFDTKHILVLDDAVYSGCNILSMIDDITYFYVPVNKKENIYANYCWHVVSPFVCSGGLNEIAEFFTDMKMIGYIYKHDTLETLDQLINLNEFDINEDDLYKDLHFESTGYPLIYFDHKVAGDCSMYPQVFLSEMSGSLFKNIPSRYKIEQLQELLLKYKVNV